MVHTMPSPTSSCTRPLRDTSISIAGTWSLGYGAVCQGVGAAGPHIAAEGACGGNRALLLSIMREA